MNNVIYHNPRCSKSRQTLALLQERGVDVAIIEYLKTPPSADEIRLICTQLGIRPHELVRAKEPEFKELRLALDSSMTDEQWYEILNRHPKLIERPIVRYNGKAAIGRPPENVLTIL